MYYMLSIILISQFAFGSGLRQEAVKHGYAPKQAVTAAISAAAAKYKINEKELLAIALTESGGKQDSIRQNRNGTIDVGAFQINTVNWQICSEYNIWQIEGNAMCAAKLLHNLKRRFPTSYLPRYHSHTESKRNEYAKRLEKFLKIGQN